MTFKLPTSYPQTTNTKTNDKHRKRPAYIRPKSVVNYKHHRSVSEDSCTLM